MNTSELDGVMRRIAKLLAIAGDDRANPEEASAAAGMAERIMRKYQIDHVDIVLTQLKSSDSMDVQDCVATAKTNGTKVLKVPPWCGFLAVRVATLNDVNAIIARKDGEAVVRFQGFKSDVMVAAYMFNYLVATTNRLCVAFRTHEKYLRDGRPAMSAYRHGVVSGILASLQTLHKEKQSDMRSVTGNALVVAKAQAVAHHFGEMKTKSTKATRRDGEAFAAGVADGRRVDVNRRESPSVAQILCS